MAQYFYDFKDLIPAANSVLGPSGMERNFTLDTTNYYQEFMKSQYGMDVWQKNPDGVASTFNFSGAYTWGPAGVTAADVDCLVKLQYMHYNGGNYSNDGPGLYARMDVRPGGANYYELQSACGLTSNASVFRKRVASANTGLGSGTAGYNNKTVPFWMRIQITGTTLRMRSWTDGTSEPGTWGQSITDSSLASAGYFGFGCLGASGTGFTQSAGTRYRLYQLSFGTGADPAPATFARAVAGTVLLPGGGAANGYLVRCYNRRTGALVGETLTNAAGSFTFTLTNTEKVYCVAVDQLGNTWNARVKDLITPA